MENEPQDGTLLTQSHMQNKYAGHVHSGTVDVSVCPVEHILHCESKKQDIKLLPITSPNVN